jgi:Matrixin
LSRLQKKSLFVLFAVVATMAAAPALAFEPGGALWPTDNGCVGTCAGQPRTIRYTIGNITDGSIKFPDETPWPPGLIRASIEEALHVWTTAVNINFVEVPDSPLTQLRFRHIYINGPDPPPPADPIPKAQATCLGYGSGCEVQYDEGDRWQLNGTQPNPDILGATIHEVGHIIGLLHTNVVGANMYWIFHRFPGLGTGQLFPDDIAGIQSRYGAGVGSVTPLGVPEPTAALLAASAMLGCLPLRCRRARS